ncbi:glycine--tRNA ligase subunit beta [Bartonella sp. A05]|uniref:glycine--tRNA ligase subunit beta n=1 Tax=Bartonella sp. A05 TaxID=2967261 RepID=UPI0022A9090E|nr:glycine--tRNA ligase subunit beta [Bartonella sp. A05]MCZ2203899.1 glycine--tRNA ligase subunit beta [Bartonella sp. A05]
MPDLLIELFSEEIPARLQRKAAADFKKCVTNKLVDAGLTYKAACEYWTPRRLTLDIRALSTRSKDIREERKGPSIQAPQKAIDGFLRAVGLDDVSQAKITHDNKKGDFYVAEIIKKGRAAEDIIADIMPNVIRNFPWPKSMRWGKDSAENGALKWIRPLQNILCVFGPETGETKVVPFAVGSLQSNDLTYGHRFLRNEKPIKVRRFDDYVAQLEEHKVILDAEQRKNIILTDAQNLCFANGLELVEDNALIEEVAGLVEWPVVLMSDFDKAFLEMPSEVIRLTIRTHQKCFVTRKQDEKEKLSNHFILVSNMLASDEGQEIAKGNSKVVNARLSDALHFWKIDQRDLPNIADLQDHYDYYAREFSLYVDKPLDQRMAQLDHFDVIFHVKLGTQSDRVKRIASLVEKIASGLNAPTTLAKRAAFLAKADLQTQMVDEFPELQGLIGKEYALIQKENPRVAEAIEDHYKPLGPTDRVPQEPVAIAVALADKIDTLVGFWLINEKPTGSKDPYALRRAALGIIRIILSHNLKINLMDLFYHAMKLLVLQRAKYIRYKEDTIPSIHTIDDCLKQKLQDAISIIRVANPVQLYSFLQLRNFIDEIQKLFAAHENDRASSDFEKIEEKVNHLIQKLKETIGHSFLNAFANSHGNPHYDICTIITHNWHNALKKFELASFASLNDWRKGFGHPEFKKFISSITSLTRSELLHASEAINNTIPESMVSEETKKVALDLLSFFHERLKVQLKDEGARHDAIEAVLTKGADDFRLVVHRVKLLTAFINTDDGNKLVVAVKRIVNILENERKKGTEITKKVNPDLFVHQAEKYLNCAYLDVDGRIFMTSNYSDYLNILVRLVEPIDIFFENVLVNDKNPDIRANRLALLECIRTLTLQVADFSKLAV